MKRPRELLRKLCATLLCGILLFALVWLYGQYNLYALQIDWTRQGYDDRAYLMQEKARKSWFRYPILFPVKYTPKGKDNGSSVAPGWFAPADGGVVRWCPVLV